MKATIKLEDGEVKTVDNLTLAEETANRVFLQDENADPTDTKEHSNGKLVSVTNPVSVGQISSLEEDEYTISDGVAYAEDREDCIYIEYEDGSEETLEGVLDRAYTY